MEEKSSAATDSRLLVLAPQDNVAVLRAALRAGETVLVGGRPIMPPRAIMAGHKVARRAIAAGDKIVKYGAPIGSATADIAIGDHVHLHNMKSDYIHTHSLEAPADDF